MHGTVADPLVSRDELKQNRLYVPSASDSLRRRHALHGGAPGSPSRISPLAALAQLAVVRSAVNTAIIDTGADPALRAPPDLGGL